MNTNEQGSQTNRKEETANPTTPTTASSAEATTTYHEPIEASTSQKYRVDHEALVKFYGFLLGDLNTPEMSKFKSLMIGPTKKDRHVIITNSALPIEEQRFSAVYSLVRYIQGDRVSFRYGDINCNDGGDVDLEAEQSTCDMAAALLIPGCAFHSALVDLHHDTPSAVDFPEIDLTKLAAMFGVSEEVMKRRAYVLGWTLE